MAANAGSSSPLTLLDLSPAFDTVNRGVHLNRLHRTTGLTDTALKHSSTYDLQLTSLVPGIFKMFLIMLLPYIPLRFKKVLIKCYHCAYVDATCTCTV